MAVVVASMYVGLFVFGLVGLAWVGAQRQLEAVKEEHMRVRRLLIRLKLRGRR
jgi:hypothetical protein